MQYEILGNWLHIRPQIETNKFDLIYNLTENGLRHASGPVPLNHPSVTFITVKMLKMPVNSTFYKTKLLISHRLKVYAHGTMF